MGGLCLSLEHKGPGASTCPQVVIFSSAPGGQLFSQEPGQALSVVSETKALTYTLLARLITFYLKLKFSNSWVPYQSEGKERERERERERETPVCVPLIYTFIGCFFYVPWLGIKPVTLVYGTMLYPTEPPSHDSNFIFAFARWLASTRNLKFLCICFKILTFEEKTFLRAVARARKVRA